MVQFFETIPANIIEWIQKQHIFWVASAPLSADGHVNVSPKGLQDSFHIIDEKTVWYEDLSGSGIETISHLRENGRITVMFTAFEGPPRICRLFGKGRVHEFGSPEYNAFIPVGTHKIGSRSVIVVDIFQVTTSCGYAVPFYEYKSNRTGLLDYYKRVEDGKTKVILDNEKESYPETDQFGMKAYWTKKNLFSLDKLPGLQTAHKLEFDPKSSYSVEECAGVVKKSARDSDGKVTAGVKIPASETQNLKLVAAFAMGMLVTATFVRLSRQL